MSMLNVKEKESGSDSRLATRQEVLESFNVNLSIPQLGTQKISLYDISISGLSFNIDPLNTFSQGGHSTQLS